MRFNSIIDNDHGEFFLDDLIYLEKYGMLYQWETILGSDSASNQNPSGVQEISPEGWHLPSLQEWMEMIQFVEAEYEENRADLILKSKTDWIPPGLDSYGFNALPSGTRRKDGTSMVLEESFYSLAA